MVVQHCSQCSRVVDVKRKYVRKTEILCSRCKQRLYRVRKAQERETKRRMLTFIEHASAQLVFNRAGNPNGLTQHFIDQTLEFIPRECWESWLQDLARLADNAHILGWESK